MSRSSLLHLANIPFGKEFCFQLHLSRWFSLFKRSNKFASLFSSLKVGPDVLLEMATLGGSPYPPLSPFPFPDSALSGHHPHIARNFTNLAALKSGCWSHTCNTCLFPQPTRHLYTLSPGYIWHLSPKMHTSVQRQHIFSGILPREVSV